MDKIEESLYTEKVNYIICRARKYCKKRKLGEITPLILFYAILTNEKHLMKELFSRLNVNYGVIIQKTQEKLNSLSIGTEEVCGFSGKLNKVMSNSINSNSGKVLLGNLLLELSKEPEISEIIHYNWVDEINNLFCEFKFNPKTKEFEWSDATWTNGDSMIHMPTTFTIFE
jgi:ATP-dependent Clp protease ATP-binding subunit ClpA